MVVNFITRYQESIWFQNNFFSWSLFFAIKKINLRFECSFFISTQLLLPQARRGSYCLRIRYLKWWAELMITFIRVQSFQLTKRFHFPQVFSNGQEYIISMYYAYKCLLVLNSPSRTLCCSTAKPNGLFWEWR